MRPSAETSTAIGCRRAQCARRRPLRFSSTSLAKFSAFTKTASPAAANVPCTIAVSGGSAKIVYTLSGVACPAEVGAVATVTGAGISGKAAGLKLKAGAKNTIQMNFSKAASGKARSRSSSRRTGAQRRRRGA